MATEQTVNVSIRPQWWVRCMCAIAHALWKMRLLRLSWWVADQCIALQTSKREPLWKRAARVLCDCFEWSDYEYLRLTINFPWPFRCWLTVWEPSRRSSWHRRLMPWRLRCALSGLVRSWIWSTCTKCGARFSLGELIARPSKLQHFQSGSICHQDCGGTLHLRAWNPEKGGYL